MAWAPGLFNYLDKVHARPDGVHIHEDLRLTEVDFQPVVNPAGTGSTIVTAVADEDLWHNPPSFGNDYWDCLCSRIVRRAIEGGKLMGSTGQT